MKTSDKLFILGLVTSIALLYLPGSNEGGTAIILFWLWSFICAFINN